MMMMTTRTMIGLAMIMTTRTMIVMMMTLADNDGNDDHDKDVSHGDDDKGHFPAT